MRRSEDEEVSKPPRKCGASRRPEPGAMRMHQASSRLRRRSRLERRLTAMRQCRNIFGAHPPTLSTEGISTKSRKAGHRRQRVAEDRSNSMPRNWANCDRERSRPMKNVRVQAPSRHYRRKTSDCSMLSLGLTIVGTETLQEQ